MEECIEEGNYLAKLCYTFTAAMMDDDLLIMRATTDEEYFPSGKGAAIPVEWILILIAFIICRKFVFKGNEMYSLKKKY
jgi:hypothetical protein